jgi:hypothetical protein
MYLMYQVKEGSMHNITGKKEYIMKKTFRYHRKCPH